MKLWILFLETNVDMAKIRLKIHGFIEIAYADLDPIETDVIVFDLTESQRANALQSSATPGGDGTRLKLDVFAGAFLDVAQNLNLLSGNLSVVRLDTTNPTITSVTIDFGYGTLLIQASETTLG